MVEESSLLFPSNPDDSADDAEPLPRAAVARTFIIASSGLRLIGCMLAIFDFNFRI
jgi:hypothetical protein